MTKSIWDLDVIDYKVLNLENEELMDNVVYVDEERGVCFQTIVTKQCTDGTEIICDPKTKLPVCKIICGKFRLLPLTAKEKKERDANL